METEKIIKRHLESILEEIKQELSSIIIEQLSININEHKDLFNKGMLANPTGYRHIRLRPHLSASEEDFNRAYKLIGETLNE